MKTVSELLRWRNVISVLALSSISSVLHADTASNVMRYSDAKILSTGKMLAEAVSRNSPAQIDAVTKLLGAIFAAETKTFIYKYEMTQSVDTRKMYPYLYRHTCADPIRKAFMYRGVTFRHVYLTPTGQVVIDVKYSNC